MERTSLNSSKKRQRQGNRRKTWLWRPPGTKMTEATIWLGLYLSREPLSQGLEASKHDGHITFRAVSRDCYDYMIHFEAFEQM